MKPAHKIEIGSNSSKSEADKHVHHLVPGIKSFSKYVGLAVSLIGMLVLSGWLLGIDQLKNAFPGLPAMKANTALAFTTAGLTLWLRGSISPKIQTAARVLGVITSLIGLLTLGEYVSGRNFGIDELIFKDLTSPSGLHPGRMSFITALNFTMMGMALFLLDSDNERRYNLGQALTLVAGIIAYIALAGYLFDVDSLYRVGVFAPIAFHTALSFILLFVGMVCAQPEDGWVGYLISDTLGGDLLRRLLPVAFLVPILLSWLQLQGQLGGYYETAFGMALLAVAITLFLSVIIWFNAKGLTRVDMDRRWAEQNLRSSEERYRNLFDLVPVAAYACDANGLIQEFNHRAVELWGREPKKNDPSEKFCGSFKIFYPDGRDMPHGECPMARMIGGETLAPHELEILVEQPDGVRRNVLAHPLAIKNERAEIVGAINCLYDITERKQAEQALTEFARQQEALYQLTDRLQHTKSLEDVFNAALDAILGALQCNRASILLFDHTDVMRFVAWRGLSEDYRKATAGHSPWKSDEKDPEPISINDIHTAELSDSLRAVIEKECIGSLAFIPLVFNGKLIGKFMIYFNAPHVFNEDEIELSLTIARQLATGIERKKDENALRTSEERLRLATQAARMFSWEFDIQNQISTVADNFTEAVGFSSGLIPKNNEEILQTFIHPEDAQLIFALLKKTIEDRNDLRSVQFRILNPENGQLIWLEVSGKVVYDSDDTPTRMFGVAQNITESKQAEEALRESEERFHAILRQATAGIVRKDAEGGFLFVNQAFCNMLGYTESELLGKTIWQLTHPDDVDENKRLYDLTMMEGIPFKLEKRLIRADGTIMWVDVSVSPIMDVAGKPQSAVAVEVDITRRKQAEGLLRENERRFREMIDALPTAIYTTDAEGRLTHFNPAATEFSGRVPELGTDHWCVTWRLYYPDGTPMPHDQCPMAIALKEGRAIRGVEAIAERPDGRRIWFEAYPTPLRDSEGRIVGGINMLVDITDRKQADEALQQLNLQLESRVQKRTVELQAANQSLRNEIDERLKVEDALHESGKRLQILSQRLVDVQEEERRAIARELHDSVGQSLSALNINLVILDNQISSHVPEEVSSRLDDSMQLVTETITLVRDVMSDLRPPVLDDYGLEAALQSHVNAFKARYGIVVQFEKQDQPIPRLGASIEMTFLRIAQEALINVARHAKAEQATLSLRQEEKVVRLTVQDNGTGITSWQEANRPGSHGLTIMRERAEAFGGDLQISSVSGKGTKVEARIPIRVGGQEDIQKERYE